MRKAFLEMGFSAADGIHPKGYGNTPIQKAFYSEKAMLLANISRLSHISATLQALAIILLIFILWQMASNCGSINQIFTSMG